MSSTYDIQGRNCLFQIKIDDVYLDVLCAKTFSFNRTYELKETTTVQSGFDKEYRPRKKSYTISFNGVVQAEADAGKPTIKTLFDHGESFLPVFYRIIYEDNSSNVLVIQGQVYISNAIFNANPINLLDGTTEMTGNGPIETFDVIPDLIVMSVSVTGQASAKIRFILFRSDGSIAYDTAVLPDTQANSGWLIQGDSITFNVQKGQYAWGVSTDDVQSNVNTFDLDVSPPEHLDFTEIDVNQNSLPTVFDFLTDKAAVFDIGPSLPPPGCVAPAIVGSPSLPDAHALSAYFSSIPLTGSTPFSLSNVTKPGWMNIIISETSPGSGSYVVSLSGLPPMAAIGTGIVVSFDVSNACGTVSFSDTIDVTVPFGTPSHIDYSFNWTGSGALGTMRIYVNGVLTVNKITEGIGSLDVNAGDVVEVQVAGPSSFTKSLIVDDDVDGELFNNSGTTTQIFSWTAELGHDYNINADVTT